MGVFCKLDREKVWKGSFHYENGVTTIRNPRFPLYGNDGAEFIEETVIKGSDLKAQYSFYKPSAISLDEDNNIYVLDSRNDNVTVFDDNGEYIRTIGTKGGGPGELEGVSQITIIHDEIAVWSNGNKRLTYYSLGGGFLRSLIGNGNMASIKIDSLGNTYATGYNFKDGREVLELNKYNSNLELIGSILSWSLAKPGLFISSAEFAISKDNNIVFGDPSDGYKIKIIDGNGEIIKIITRKHQQIRIPKKEMEFVLAQYGRFPGQNEMPTHYMPFWKFYVDDDGKIIVNTFVDISENKRLTFDLFNSEGKYLTTFKTEYFISCLWANHKLYTIEEDNDGFYIVRVRRVDWKY